MEGILLIELSDITFKDVIGFLIVGYIIWQVIKHIMEIARTTEKAVTRKQGWDYAAKVIKEKEQIWDKSLADVDNVREQITESFNGRLDEQDARTQQLISMQCMCLRAQDAILGALVNNNIGNGDIKKMHEELKDFIMEQLEK